MCVTNILHFLAWGLTPGPKFTKNEGDLLPIQVYDPAKFHCPVSTHAGDICYKKICGHTNKEGKKPRKKQTVNHITPPCLSACGKKYYRSGFYRSSLDGPATTAISVPRMSTAISAISGTTRWVHSISASLGRPASTNPHYTTLKLHISLCASST